MALWRTEPAREGETSLKACLVPELSLPAVKRPNPCGRGHGRARPGGGAAANPRRPPAQRSGRGREAAGAHTASAVPRRGEPGLPAASTPSPFGFFTREHRAVFDTPGRARSLTREGKNPTTNNPKIKFAPFLREEARLPWALPPALACRWAANGLSRRRCRPAGAKVAVVSSGEAAAGSPLPGPYSLCKCSPSACSPPRGPETWCRRGGGRWEELRPPESASAPAQRRHSRLGFYLGR